MKNAPKRKALITGITGMVGSHLADFLLANTDWDIYGMCRWRSPLDNVEHLLDRANRKDRLFFVNGDLCDYISLQHVVNEVKPDYVFHLAAQSYPKTSFSSPLQTYDTNILGTERLLEALRFCPGIDPFIHVCSSSEVFGRVSREKLPISEDCSFHPASPYSISKIGTDLIGQFHAEAYKQKVMVTRMFTHSVSKWTPVILRDTKSYLIDIKYISEIRNPLKKGGYFSGTKLDDGTQIWDMSRSDLEVWNDNKWTKVKHLSCHPINNHRMLEISCRCGVIDVTDNHSIIDENGIEVQAGKLSVKDKVKLTSLPVNEITYIPDELAWLYGFFVAEGCVTGGRMRFDNTDINKIKIAQTALLEYLAIDSVVTDNKDGLFRLVIRKPFNIAKRFFQDCYASDGNKKVPKIILNAEKRVKLSFLRGYNAGDGDENNSINSEFYRFKTKSPILASALCFLIETVLDVKYRIHVEHREDKRYFEIRAFSQKDTDNGEWLLKDDNSITKIREIEYSGEVWDFETENHWFHAGIGGNIVHNTGPRRGDVFVESTFAKQIAMIEAGLLPPIVKVGNLESLRTWADVRDAVRAYYMLLTVNPKSGEVYNIGGSRTCSVREMLEFLLSCSTDKAIKVEIDPSRLRPLDADLQVPDCSKFIKHTGWEPEIAFEKTMKDLLDYWRERVKAGKSFLSR